MVDASLVDVVMMVLMGGGVAEYGRQQIRRRNGHQLPERTDFDELREDIGSFSSSLEAHIAENRSQHHHIFDLLREHETKIGRLDERTKGL